MSTFRKITKREAIKRFNEGLTFVLCPRKMRPGYPFAMHSTIGPEAIEECKRHADWYNPEKRTDNPPSPLWKGDINTTAWGLLYREWAHYNTSWETGYYASYYIEND